MKYRIGDTVRISKKSHYYGFSLHDPKDTDGIIVALVSFVPNQPIVVEWIDGTHNTYTESSLKLRKRGNNE